MSRFEKEEKRFYRTSGGNPVQERYKDRRGRVRIGNPDGSRRERGAGYKSRRGRR